MVSAAEQAEIRAEKLDEIRQTMLQAMADAGHAIRRSTSVKSYIARHDDPKDKVSLSREMTLETAEAQIKQERRVLSARTGVQHDFRCRREEGAIAIRRVLESFYGISGQDLHTTMWGEDYVPPSENIPIGVSVDDEGNVRVVYESAPMYSFSFPLLDTTIELTTWTDDENAEMLRVQADTKMEYKESLEGFLATVEEELRTNSIYRNQLLSYRPLDDGTYKLEFIHLETNPYITYTRSVEADLFNHMWGKIENRQMLIEGGRPTSFRCLVYGPLGTGKSETCRSTVLKAIEAGYTVIVYSPQGQASVKDFARCFKLAERYGPTVVYNEDFDKFFNDEISGADRSTLTNLLDGVDKRRDVSIIMTTNFVERIDPAMTRGQRMTGVIEIGPLDDEATERMLRGVLGDQLDPDTDFSLVWQATQGFSPAYLMNSFEQAQLISSMHHKRHDAQIGTEGLVGAANSMRKQRDLNQYLVDLRTQKKPGLAELATDAVVGWVREHGRKIRFSATGFSIKD